MSEKSSKDLAQRIDPVYYRRRHPLRRLRLLLSAGLVAGGVVWVATSFALSGEGIYVRGGVARAHGPVADECSRCHVDAFRAVIDAACLSCHAVLPHVPAGKTPSDPRCGTCHAEHGGRVRLAEVADGHCNACHTSHRAITSIEDHAQFERAPLDQHLRFNHRAHLAKDLLGGPLACADCHRPQPDARDFEPIRFEAHCAKCHAERLHPELKDAVPHGVEPTRLREWAAAAFVRAFLEDPALAQPPSRPNVAPGRSPGAPPDWTATLRASTDAALDALLTPGRGCLLCHEGDRERIVPPEIPSNWFPKARFDHKTHRAEPCFSCHRALGSTEAMAVDLPGVQSCRTCHGRGGAPASCATCHPYHPRDAAAWR
jgi:predicted CXXCH cytochrome family protein